MAQNMSLNHDSVELLDVFLLTEASDCTTLWHLQFHLHILL